jgi:hypothetical protein
MIGPMLSRKCWLHSWKISELQPLLHMEEPDVGQVKKRKTSRQER